MLWFLSEHSLNAVVYIPLVKTQKWVKVHYILLVVGASNLGTYSHISNKRDIRLTDFGKFHPAQNKNPP